MSQPIYKMYYAKFNDAWYRLSPEEQEDLLRKVREARDATGGKRVMACDCRWANEAWDMFGIEEYPNIEAVQIHTKAMQELGWYGYVEANSILGIDWEMR